ncbi:MAG TPA: SpoIIE family protein phosphatase [Solirubrobacter sp.]|nr:SpoIIE family protein phosphatase [Solirubrobacter sp.]
MGAALKPPRVTRSVRRRVGAATALAEVLLERRHPAVTRRLTSRERRVEFAVAALFVAVAAAMAVTADGVTDAGTAALLVVSYALLRRVRFQLGPGLIRPTEIVFVPMLFLAPPAAAPALVALGAVIGELPDLARRSAHPERLAVVLADGWYSVGPAVLIAATASGAASDAPAAILLAALAAQFAVDLAASIARESLGAGISAAELLPVLALVYLIDALLAPIGYLAALASEAEPYAYLLAIAPGALLGLIARERTARITHELALERAFRRSTRALDARAAELHHRVAAPATTEDRAKLERMLLATTVEALQADSGRLSEVTDGGLEPRLAVGLDHADLAGAELALGAIHGSALAIGVGLGHVLAVARSEAPFSPVERDLLEHLAAQAAVSLENLRLEEQMRRREAELRAILEGVADAVAAEGPDGELVYVNSAAERLLEGADGLAAALGVAPDRLPGRRVFAGAEPDPLVVRHSGRWSRVKAGPVLDDDGARLAISVVEDITEIKQAEESQRFLAESSRVLAGSLELDDVLPAVARLAAAHVSGACAIELGDEVPVRAGPAGAPTPHAIPIRTRDGAAGTIALSRPLDRVTAEDLALRVGAAVENARLYQTRAKIARTLQQSLLPPELPRIPGLETAALYRAAGAGNEVGGDFYDLFATGEREWFAVMGDVCGKGAEAAAVTALVRYTIRAAVSRHRSPAGILRWLNAAMLRQRAGRFVTLACARLDLDDGAVTATVACGGHPPPRILRSTGLVEAIGTSGTLLGVLARVEAVDRSARLAPGDALILYTDGLTEASAPQVWTAGQLDAAVAGARRRSAQGIVEHLAEQAGGPQRDDLALLALRVHPLL